ncbi:DUF86 domain-containing protein [uncultured Adlercreutzia sp.]|uniref:HepT-like ribonuclease domain-containing protein n=1 Tax=uncultured Adlercreutzia sp. TaxID=875803 RepID=UPI0025D29855|nr:HepT-like ribonuclease domain-containing protein [uncultured Adlercreutzia sp.]
MNESDRLILQQILEYCDSIASRIEEFGIDENLFVENSAYFDMLLMPVFQIGELANALTREFTDADSMPWHAINGFRNIIAHDYGVVDSLWAWNTIQSDIPALAAHLEKLLD